MGNHFEKFHSRNTEQQSQQQTNRGDVDYYRNRAGMMGFNRAVRLPTTKSSSKFKRLNEADKEQIRHQREIGELLRNTPEEIETRRQRIEIISDDKYEPADQFTGYHSQSGPEYSQGASGMPPDFSYTTYVESAFTTFQRYQHQQREVQNYQQYIDYAFTSGSSDLVYSNGGNANQGDNVSQQSQSYPRDIPIQPLDQVQQKKVDILIKSINTKKGFFAIGTRERIYIDNIYASLAYILSDKIDSNYWQCIQFLQNENNALYNGTQQIYNQSFSNQNSLDGIQKSRRLRDTINTIFRDLRDIGLPGID